MPSIRLSTFDGYCHQLDSTNPAVIAAWLAEWVIRLTSANSSMQPMITRIEVYPILDEYDRLKLGEFTFYNFTEADMQKLLKLLHESKKEEPPVSAAKWCDVGKHAFSGNDVDSTALAVTKQVENQFGGSQPHTQQQDICGDCAARMGLLGRTRQKEVLSLESGKSPEQPTFPADPKLYQEWLEWQNGLGPEPTRPE